MSNNLEHYRRCLKSVKPLLKNESLKFDSLKDNLNKKNREFDRYKLIYDQKLLRKNELLLKIESITGSGQSLDLAMLNNAKYYLIEVNDDLIDASSSLETKKQAVDKANNKLIECHVDVKLMEKYEADRKSEFKIEIDKIESRQIEDLWLQKKIMELSNGEIKNV